MAGKHRKPQGTHGIGTGGHIRWERAAANALLRPNSKNARLYLSRVALAHQVTEEVRADNDLDHLQAYRFNKLQYQGGGRPPTGKPGHVTCSVFCTVMQMTLEFGADTLEKVRDTFSENFTQCTDWRLKLYEDTGVAKLVAVDKKSVKKTAKCRYCGSQVNKKR